MKLLSQTLSVLLMLLFLQGCQLGQDDEETVEEATDITRAVDGTVETINRTNLYSFIVTGDSNVFELEDDLESITVTGSDNIITIIEDTALLDLTVTGSNNTVKLAADLSTRIDDLIISNEGNTVIITEYVNLSDSGTNTTVTATEVTP